MATDYEIRRVILSNQARVRNLMISKNSISLYKFCREMGGAMTYQIADEFNISIQSASTRLKKLLDLGYLSRNELTAESGGIEYMYYANER